MNGLWRLCIMNITRYEIRANPVRKWVKHKEVEVQSLCVRAPSWQPELLWSWSFWLKTLSVPKNIKTLSASLNLPDDSCCIITSSTFARACMVASSGHLLIRALFHSVCHLHWVAPSRHLGFTIAQSLSHALY